MSTVLDLDPPRRAPAAGPPRLGLANLWRACRGGEWTGAPSDHFDGRTFRNPDGPTGKSFADVWRWQRTRTPAPWPAWVEHAARPALPATLGAHELALTFVNHVTFLAQFRGLNVVTDPVWSRRASPVPWAGPARVHAPGLALDALPPVQLVLVSHDHYDHLDAATLLALEARHAPTVVTGLGNGRLLRSLGLARVVELDWWQGTEVAGARVTMTPAHHWSGRAPRRRNRTLWGGFVVERDGRSLYFAGDTGYGRVFGDLRERIGAPDVALLPIGAYAPRWFMREQHMDPHDAVRAHVDLGARTSIGTHFGCFQLTDEGIDEPLVRLAEARIAAGVDEAAFTTLVPGETRRLR